VTQLFARASFDGRARESRRSRGTHSRGGHTVEPPGSHPGGQRLAALRVTDRSRLVGWSSPALMSSTFSDAPRRRASTAGPSPWDGRKLEPPVTSLEACRMLLVRPRRPLASLLPEAAREPSGRLQSCPFAPAVARVGCAFELAFVGESSRVARTLFVMRPPLVASARVRNAPRLAPAAPPDLSTRRRVGRGDASDRPLPIHSCFVPVPASRWFLSGHGDCSPAFGRVRLLHGRTISLRRAARRFRSPVADVVFPRGCVLTEPLTPLSRSQREAPGTRAPWTLPAPPRPFLAPPRERMRWSTARGAFHPSKISAPRRPIRATGSDLPRGSGFAPAPHASRRCLRPVIRALASLHPGFGLRLRVPSPKGSAPLEASASFVDFCNR